MYIKANHLLYKQRCHQYCWGPVYFFREINTPPYLERLLICQNSKFDVVYFAMKRCFILRWWVSNFYIFSNTSIKYFSQIKLNNDHIKRMLCSREIIITKKFGRKNFGREIFGRFFRKFRTISNKISDKISKCIFFIFDRYIQNLRNRKTKLIPLRIPRSTTQCGRFGDSPASKKSPNR